MESSFNIRFIPRTIFEIPPSTVEISQTVNVSFENIQDLIEGVPPDYLYITELEVNAQYEGDFDSQTLSQNPITKEITRSLSHSPTPALKQIGSKSLEDRVTVVLDKNKPINCGFLQWEIPTLIYNAQKYLSINEENPPEVIFFQYDAEDKPNLELTVQEYQLELIREITVVQRYILENGFLTMMKHQNIQLQYDLKSIGFS